MSTVDRPLGAVVGASSVDLGVPVLGGETELDSSLGGRLGVAAVLAAALLICVAAANTNTLLPESIRPVIGLPLEGVFSAIRLHLRSGEVLGALMLMFIGYVMAVRHAERLSRRLLFGGIGAFLLLVLLAPPLFSTDLFSYQEYARMFFGLHVNPYTHNDQVLGCGAQPLDNICGFIGSKWINTPTVYGPLFTLISGLFEKTSTTAAIAFSAYAYKVIAVISTVAILYMMWRMARLRGLNPMRGIALFGLNPLVILYGVGGGHNDLLMMVFATAAIWTLLAHRERSSGALTVAAAAIKLTGGLVLPFALAANPGLGARSRRQRLLVGAAGAGVVTLAVGFVVFGTGMTQMLSTLSRVQGEGGWQSLPGFLSTAFLQQTTSHFVSTLFGVVFVGIFVRLLWRVWRGDMDWIDGLAWATLWLLLTTSTILPWYLSWLLVPVALSTQTRLWKATVWFTGWVLVTTMLVYLPHAPTILGFAT